MCFIEQSCQQTEGENLSVVGVSRKLQIEMIGTGFVDDGLVLQQEGKQVVGECRQQMDFLIVSGYSQ